MGCFSSGIPIEPNINKALEIHNQKRKEHGSPPLKINEALNGIAQRFAELLYKKGIQPEEIFNDEFLGQNIFILKGKIFNVEDMCNSWYEEKNEYEKNPNKYSKNTSHFTQMIWKSTTDVGFGFKKMKKDHYYAVAFYYPPGNALGEYKENVLLQNSF